VPGPQPLDSQATKVVIEQDMHHLSLPRVTNKSIILVMDDL
jgi:hypothetical protein